MLHKPAQECYNKKDNIHIHSGGPHVLITLRLFCSRRQKVKLRKINKYRKLSTLTLLNEFACAPLHSILAQRRYIDSWLTRINGLLCRHAGARRGCLHCSGDNDVRSSLFIDNRRQRTTVRILCFFFVRGLTPMSTALRPSRVTNSSSILSWRVLWYQSTVYVNPC